MKFLVVACLVALAVGKDLRDSQEVQGRAVYTPRIVEMIRQNGYKAEVIHVQTSDGYMLQLIRIPSGRNGSLESRDNQESSNQASRKRVVLLMHNMLGSAEDWIYGGPSQGLAYQMADSNIDVYLGNSRGTTYGMSHTTLDSSRDASFWDFCWDDIATRDIPAIVNKVVETSRQRHVQIVGHMTGATAAVVMATEIPLTRAHVSRIIALGPISFMKRATQPFMKAVQPNRQNKAWIMKNLGISALTPSTQLMREVQAHCKDMHQSQDDQVCENFYFLANGFNSKSLNQTTMMQVMQGVPTGGSVKQILHMAQLMDSGRFQKYQPSPDKKPEEYKLSQATVPITVMYTSQDRLSHNDDVQDLIKKLPNVQWSKMEDITNNVDFLYSNNVDKINRKIIETVNKITRSEDAGQEDNSVSNMSM